MQKLKNKINKFDVTLKALNKEFKTAINDPKISLNERLNFFFQAPDYLKVHLGDLFELQKKCPQTYAHFKTMYRDRYQVYTASFFLDELRYHLGVIADANLNANTLKEAQFNTLFTGEYNYDYATFKSTMSLAKEILKANLGSFENDW